MVDISHFTNIYNINSVFSCKPFSHQYINKTNILVDKINYYSCEIIQKTITQHYCYQIKTVNNILRCTLDTEILVMRRQDGLINYYYKPVYDILDEIQDINATELYHIVFTNGIEDVIDYKPVGLKDVVNIKINDERYILDNFIIRVEK